jgi:preprotein translocase subunit SecB
MAEAEKPQQQFAIQRIYLKDISFETPSSPAIFLEKWEPAVSVELNTQINKLGDALYEVVLKVTATTKAGEKTAYLVEVQQAGIFLASGFSDAELGQVLGAYCPNVLFPYARQAVSDVVLHGSFPQLVLNPVNFDALYAQHLKQQSAAAGESPVH